MRDETVDRLTRLLDAGHLRWRGGRAQFHAACGDEDRRWLERHRDAIVAELIPFPDEATATTRIITVFDATPAVDADRSRTEIKPRPAPILPDGPPHQATCDRCHRPAGTAATPLFGMRGVEPMLCRNCWEGHS